MDTISQYFFAKDVFDIEYLGVDQTKLEKFVKKIDANQKQCWNFFVRATSFFPV